MPGMANLGGRGACIRLVIMRRLMILLQPMHTANTHTTNIPTAAPTVSPFASQKVGALTQPGGGTVLTFVDRATASRGEASNELCMADVRSAGDELTDPTD